MLFLHKIEKNSHIWRDHVLILRFLIHEKQKAPTFVRYRLYRKLCQLIKLDYAITKSNLRIYCTSCFCLYQRATLITLAGFSQITFRLEL